MNNRIAPETLRTARLARAFTLKALSDETGISSATLSRIESGERQVDQSELNQLAEALGQPSAALCRSLVSDRLGLSAFYHRKMSRASGKAVRAVESQCMLNIVPLRELFSMVSMPEDTSVFTLNIDDARGSAEVAASMVRQAWKLPDGPIQNIFDVVESAGCVVIHTDFNIPEMDALYQKVAGAPPVFWVNSNKPLDRVRFSVAHELGHLILHEDRPIDDSQAEREADQFAAAFLMPRGDFRASCPARLKVPQLVELKKYWRCSMSAIARRARDTNRITPEQYTSIMIQFSKRGWRKHEPYPIIGESPSLLSQTIKSCMKSCEMLIEELAKSLLVPTEQLIDWLQPFPGQLPDPIKETPTLRLVNGISTD